MAAFEQFLSDKYLSALHSPLLQSYMPQTASEKDRFELSSMSDAPTLLDFVGSTPAPVTRLLVDYSSTVLALKRLAFAASWRGAAEDSFLLLCAWWTACLYGELLIRYALPLLLILGPLVIPLIPQRFRNKKAAPLTEDALASSISALDAIYALRPDWNALLESQPSLSPRERLRLLAYLFVPWVTLTYWVSTRILIGIAGTILLTYRAPWFVTTRGILSRSAYARAAWRYALSWVSGSATLPLSFRKTAAALSLGKGKDKVEEEINGTKSTRQHSFLFTVLENQRWWVGIDWTAALLPSERPSWCAPVSAASISTPQSPQSPTQAQATYVPLPPPATFPLPASTSVILPSPDGKGYIKRTAHWRWEDNSEWEVLVHKEGEKEVKTVRKPIKASNSDDDAKGAALAKAATAGKANNGMPTTPNVGEDPAAGGANAKVPLTPAAHALAEQEYTDQDGWIYGDNKWENASHKAGMGKFTRFRRWCRVAILEEEEEEVVDATEAHPSFTQLEVPKVPLVEKPKTPIEPSVERSRSLKEAFHIKESSKKEESPERTRDTTRDSIGRDGSLQQRLKAALKGGS